MRTRPLLLSLLALVGLAACNGTPPGAERGPRAGAEPPPNPVYTVDRYWALDPIEFTEARPGSRPSSRGDAERGDGGAGEERAGENGEGERNADEGASLSGLERLGLTSVGTFTAQASASGEGGLTAPFVTLNASAERVQIYSDNIIYMSRPFWIELKHGGENVGRLNLNLIIGVGVRIAAELEAGEGDVNVSAIPGIGVSGAGNVKSVAANVQTVGVISDAIVKMPRFTGEITRDNLYNFFQNLSLINSEIANGATLVPHIMGFHARLPPGVTAGRVADAIRGQVATALTRPQTDLARPVDLFTFGSPIEFTLFQSVDPAGRPIRLTGSPGVITLGDAEYERLIQSRWY